MSQIHFLRVDATGAIHGHGSCAAAAFPWHEPPPDGTLAVVDADTAHAVFGDRDNWRLLGGVPVQREAMAVSVSKTAIAADGQDLAVLTGFPGGCTVRVTGAVQLGPVLLDETPEPIEIALTVPGSVVVELRRDPTHKPFRTTIHAAA